MSSDDKKTLKMTEAKDEKKKKGLAPPSLLPVPVHISPATVSTCSEIGRAHV